MQKILFTLIITAIFLLSNSNLSIAYEKEIKSICSTLAEDIARAGKKMIAVVDFTDLQGNVTELGRFLAEEFSVSFARAGKGFEVVDRTHLKNILAEHKLTATGIIDPQTARKLGQIAGVDSLITGTITPFGDSVRVSVKVLDTATAKVIGASSGDIAKTKAIEELLARSIEASQPLRQEPSAPSVSSYSTTSSNSKKIGPLVINLQKIVVSKGTVSAYLGFANQSEDAGFRLGRGPGVGSPTLTDEKGNVLLYDERSSGLPTTAVHLIGTSSFSNFGFTLPAKSANEMALVFLYGKDIDTKGFGEYFSVNLKYKLYNEKNGSISDYSVSFTDIKAQKPR